MITLADEIAKLRARLADQHGNEMYAVARLGADIVKQQQALAAEVARIVEQHEEGRVALVEQLVTLARRVGALPAPVDPLPIAPAPPPPALEDVLAPLSGRAA